jgi:membrane protease subunit (stomatin/prohibitin family)
MGLWDRITSQAKAQFLDVIQWMDGSNDTLVWRFPIQDQAITDKSKVIVREGQAACFVAEGRLSDTFAPGTYTLATPNTPIYSFFQSIAYALETPYKGDILFVSTRQFTNQGWGTQAPFMMRDPEFGPVRVRAFGSFSFRVVDPALFIREIVGTDGHFTTEEISGQLKKELVTAIVSAIGQSKVALLDLVSAYDAIGKQVREQIDPGMKSKYGLALTDLTISNIGLPPEVEEALDQRSKMGILGNLNAYTQLKTAEAIGDAARNPGMGGAGVGMGVGVGMGQMMAGMMGQVQQGGFGQPAAPAAPPPPPGMAPPPPPQQTPWHYSGPGGQSQGTLDQVVAAVIANPAAAHHVWQPGWPAWKSVLEVPEIAARLPPPPPPAP